MGDCAAISEPFSAVPQVADIDAPIPNSRDGPWANVGFARQDDQLRGDNQAMKLSQLGTLCQMAR